MTDIDLPDDIAEDQLSDCLSVVQAHLLADNELRAQLEDAENADEVETILTGRVSDAMIATLNRQLELYQQLDEGILHEMARDIYYEIRNEDPRRRG